MWPRTALGVAQHGGRGRPRRAASWASGEGVQRALGVDDEDGAARQPHLHVGPAAALVGIDAELLLEVEAVREPAASSTLRSVCSPHRPCTPAPRRSAAESLRASSWGGDRGGEQLLDLALHAAGFPARAFSAAAVCTSNLAQHLRDRLQLAPPAWREPAASWPRRSRRPGAPAARPPPWAECAAWAFSVSLLASSRPRPLLRPPPPAALDGGPRRWPRSPRGRRGRPRKSRCSWCVRLAESRGLRNPPCEVGWAPQTPLDSPRRTQRRRGSSRRRGSEAPLRPRRVSTSSAVKATPAGLPRWRLASGRATPPAGPGRWCRRRSRRRVAADGHAAGEAVTATPAPGEAVGQVVGGGLAIDGGGQRQDH